ncbi:hypothetical protein JCM8547_007399 [Rhodosporidiobolus lusitaniae]
MAHTELFSSAAVLDLVIPSSPSLIHSAPAPSTFASISNERACEAVDTWADSLLRGSPRPQLFIDERVRMFAVLALPTSSSSSLSRAQAAVLLLRSLPQPHLSLTLDLAYADPSSSSRTPYNPSTSVFGQQQASAPLPPPVRTSSLAHKVPITPAPFPTTLPEEGEEGGGGMGLGGATNVPVASVAFAEDGRVWVAKDGEGRWVVIWELEAVIPVLRSQFPDPKLSLTVTVTLRDDPHLELVLEQAKDGILPGDGGEGGVAGEDLLDDDEYMEEGDTFDHVNLLAALSPVSSTPLHLPYSRLPSSYLPCAPPPKPTHRPTRSRSYSLTTSSTPLHPSLRRSCRRFLPVRSAIQVAMHTLPCPVGVLGVPEGGRVWERDNEDGVVLCLEVSGPPGGSSEEGFEIEVIEVSVEGGGGTSAGGGGGGLGLGSSREQQDVEVREVKTAGVEFPLRVYGGGTSQHNFLYALATVPSAGGGGVELAAGRDERVETVPIAVASSPTRRFTARFGAEEVSEEATARTVGEIALRRGSVAPVATAPGGEGAREKTWLRNVAIVVRGRPFGGKKGKGRAREGEGYAVPDAAARGENEIEGDEQEEEEEAAEPFSSRWNCTLDISSFARPSPRHFAAFSSPSSSAQPLPAPRPTSVPSQLPPPSFRAPFVPLPPSRPSSQLSHAPPQVEYESIAGSKRHTMSSLSSLSLKSPIINRRSSAAFAFPRPHLPHLHTAAANAGGEAGGGRRPSRALPPTPMSPPAVFTPGVTGAPKRFFTLPGAESASTGDLHHHHQQQQQGGSILSTIRSETPPMAGQRTSLPPIVGGGSDDGRAGGGGGGLERPGVASRTSWMSNLVGGGVGGATLPPARASSLNASTGSAGAGGTTSWDRRASTVGLGLSEEVAITSTGGGAAPGYIQHQQKQFQHPFQPQPQQQHQQQMGKLLISVSLVPLRTAKSRRATRPPFSGAGTETPSANDIVGRTNENLPPPTLPGLAPSSPDPASVPPTPRFSFPPASPDPSSSSSSSSPAVGTPILVPSSSSPFSPSLPITSSTPDRTSSQAQHLALSTTSHMPRVNLLDVFLVEVFVSNQSDAVKRFTVGVPPPPETPSVGAGGGGGGRKSRERGREERTARVVPLENDVRIGPLAPNSCASVGLRFLAIRPGAHCVEALRLRELASGEEVRLERPVWVVVE